MRKPSKKRRSKTLLPKRKRNEFGDPCRGTQRRDPAYALRVPNRLAAYTGVLSLLPNVHRPALVGAQKEALGDVRPLQHDAAK